MPKSYRLSLTRFKKVAKKACFLFYRRKPQFMFSYRYLSPGDDVYLQFHRKLFMVCFRNPQQIFLQIMAWLYWSSFEVWKLSYLTAKQASQEALQRYQLTRMVFFYQLIHYGLCYQLSPRQYIQYQLYKPGANRLIYNHVFDHQLPWFHHYINRNIPEYSQTIKWIADKVKFARALQAIGIDTVVGEVYETTWLKKNSAILFQKKSIFCKPNQGSQSTDCFLIYYHATEDGYSLEPIHGSILHNEQEIQCFLTQVFERQTHLVIQDYLVAHPCLGDRGNATTTVRIITGRCTLVDVPKLLYLQLERAKDKKTTKKKREYQYYDIIPLHVDTLEKDPVFIQRFACNPSSDFVMFAPCKHLLRAAISMCLAAHQRLLPLMSVAFDVILSSNGPVILEANFNWAVSVLYRVLPIETLHDDHHPAACWLKSMMQLQSTREF